MQRPSETIQAAISSILGAALIIAGAAGWDTSKITPEVMGAVVLLAGYVSLAVTWYTARKQAQGTLTSGNRGQVLIPPSK